MTDPIPRRTVIRSAGLGLAPAWLPAMAAHAQAPMSPASAAADGQTSPANVWSGEYWPTRAT